jgi:Fe-S-cluster containining protein
MFQLKDLNIDPTSNAHSRRSLLISAMANLEGKKIHCMNCTGTCCTFVANSMQITPLEALEILEGLQLTPESEQELRTKLQETVRNYRLDQELATGKRGISTLRRTYTCPFFTPGPKGCSLSRTIKPYGCLAFNPKIEGDNGSACASDIPLLEKRENENVTFETEANKKISEAYKLSWTKMDLPRALLFFLDQMKSNA